MTCTRMAIFETFWPFLLLKPFKLYPSIIDVKQMPLSQSFEEIVMVLLPQIHQKNENMAILSIIMAILGHFSRFSLDNHLGACFSDQQEFN